MGRWSFLPFVADDPKPAPRQPSDLEREKTPAPKPAAAPSGSRLPGWNPPANMPKPPVASQGSAPPPPQPVNSVRDWLHRPGGWLGPDKPPLTTEQRTVLNTPPPPPSPAVRALLESQNWNLPEPGKPVEMPEGQLDEKNTRDLLDYSYRLTPQEWKRITDTYGSTAAQAQQYGPPITTPAADAPTLQVDDLQAAPLTWDAYQALPADQKAAIDLNTLLIGAREEDLSKSWALTPEEQTLYDENVKKIFGEGGGSAHVSPNTVNLLSKMDFSMVGQDLDDYLSLDRAIDMDELQDFSFSDKDVVTLSEMVQSDKPAVSGKAQDEYAAVRTPENLLALDTTAIEKSRGLIEAAMQDANNALWSFNAGTSGAPATAFASDKVPLGYGNTAIRGNDVASAEVDVWMQDAYSWLADPTKDAASVEQDMLDRGFSADDRQMFLDYVANRTALEGQYGGPVNPNITGTPRSAAEIRRLAGLKD